jgi:DNA-binding response OmpR family regulator/glycine cleavage system H lipoate-binding protein
MSDNPRLLVVDDEAVICQACRRVLSRQGFQVEESTDAQEGLSRAREGDYAAILLDIKMPEMDGIQFLEELRKKKPDVPVMIMTGYPSIPNAAAAVRLGASDYVTKPFTPEQITQSVRRMLARHVNGKDRLEAAVPTAEAWAPRAGDFFFLDESWLQLEIDGSASVGAVLTCSRGSTVRAVRLPQVGEAVYQGLPLAGVTFTDDSMAVVPSPISGVVVAVNELLADDPSLLLTDPCGKGWMACICTTRLEEEIDSCKPRRVILVNANEASAGDQCGQLGSLGCRVHVAKDWEELAPAVQDPGYELLVLDAGSVGAEGPGLVARAKAAAPSMRIVVVASDASQWEAAYREQGIFYYAVEPFADREIVEIVDAAFRPQRAPSRAAERTADASEPVHGLRIINRNGHKVQLLAAPGLLRRNAGLGWQIRRRLADQAFPIVTTPGDADVTPAAVLAAAGTYDRVMVLLAQDTGRLPGSLVRDTKAEYVSASRENAGRVTTLVVQPDLTADDILGFDERTTAALAEHIVQEMAAY